MSNGKDLQKILDFLEKEGVMYIHLDDMYLSLSISKMLKNYLVNLAVEDKLPTDLNQLDVGEIACEVYKAIRKSKEKKSLYK